jgi:toxin ParE1/3/4
MGGISFAPAARQDLEEIGDYIAADSPSAARRFLAELHGRCALITEAPRGGRTRPELYPGLRSLPFHRYVIFYTVDGQDVRIERILHGARDIEQVFERDGS